MGQLSCYIGLPQLFHRAILVVLLIQLSCSIGSTSSLVKRLNHEMDQRLTRKVTIFHDVGSAKQTCLHLGRATKRVEIDEQIFCAVLLGYFWEMKKNQQLWVCLHPHIMNIEHIHVVDLGQKSSKVLYFAFSWR